ncbi:serine/threonine-protein kinase ULK1a isoform X2 [Antennarius striatus]|uniref:serine/threonine-protein kinase ULK1a isoform X2 n=1 Tax=Antennarius striatus TaxID=241820 RepID=UPI0035B1CC83
METVGKCEFSRRNLIGHGAFAVVFKGRLKQEQEQAVAVKCINKKRLGRSAFLLEKEIKILKELKHENIVGLLDYQESKGCVYLIMEFCNGGDLSEYLHRQGSLSEDTIRSFLQQIAEAMREMWTRDIIHRDLKPQNILLCHQRGRRGSPTRTRIKIADFGFARHLQTNTMADTLCGSPLYMAPEVIMMQGYDAKADLWSIGTITYQCLTGAAPFHASTPHQLRRFYESNTTLLPSIPGETSPHLRHLLVGLLQRNPKQRMGFDEFFHHPFLEKTPPIRRSSPPPLPPPLASDLSSGSSSSGSSASHPASHPSPQVCPPSNAPGELVSLHLIASLIRSSLLSQPSDENPHRRQPQGRPSSTGASPVLPPRETATFNEDSWSDSSMSEDFVLLSDEFPGEKTCEVRPPHESSPTRGRLTWRAPPLPSPWPRPHLKPVSKAVRPVGPACNRAGAVPVPTQVQNYQRMAQKWQRGAGAPQRSPPSVGVTSEQMDPLSTRLYLQGASGPQVWRRIPKISQFGSAKLAANNFDFQQQVQSGPLRRNWAAPDLRALVPFPASQTSLSRKTSMKRSLSPGRLTAMLLKAVYGSQLFDEGTNQSTSVDQTVAPSSSSPTWFLPALGAKGGREAMTALRLSGLVFQAPELPEDNLLEQAHREALDHLRFTLAFVHCIMELASSKDPGLGDAGSPDVSFLEQSVVTDQISLLTKDWSAAEQLVLFMMAEEFLSSALHAAKDSITQGQLHPYSTVKKAIKKLNELYKSCVASCRSLSERLQTFLLDKQKLMEHFNGVSAEELLYNYSVHMVQSAALDEMFSHDVDSVQRYHKALLLMEGLSRLLTEQKDAESVQKCKQSIERRLMALQD